MLGLDERRRGRARRNDEGRKPTAAVSRSGRAGRVSAGPAAHGPVEGSCQTSGAGDGDDGMRPTACG
jgi:hypothetical protein